VSQASQISDQVLVACSDHFFDGLPENQEILNKARIENPDASFITLPFDKTLGKNPQFWVTMARWNALQHVKQNLNYILFLDADEIPDATAMKNFFSSFNLKRYSLIKLANYYYFRESGNRATTLEDSVTLVRKSLLTREIVVDFLDRHKAWECLPDPKKRMITGKNGLPMIHHFSWVRTKEEMLRKVQSWGHAGERNWEKLVEEEFSRPFSGTDFVHGYQYESVPKPFPEIGL
jgi:hypothetical protein